MNELALFAGMGGGILGGKLLGWHTVCAVEINDYCRRILMQRQDDGCLEPFPIWDDITTFDGRPWAGCVDIITGGFPCQDISAAGRGAGIDGERSGLWREMARVIGEVRPRFVLVENSPVLTVRGLGTVLGDLAALGYDAEWGVLGAADLGAPHKRDRIWIVAHSDGNGMERRLRQDRKPLTREICQGGFEAGRSRKNVAHANSSAFERRQSERPGILGAESSEGSDDYLGGSSQDVANPRSGRCHRPERGEMELQRGAETVGASDLVADADCSRQLQPQGREPEQRRRTGDGGSKLSNTHGEGLAQRQGITGNDGPQQSPIIGNHRTFPDWPADPAEALESRVGRVVDGYSARVDEP